MRIGICVLPCGDLLLHEGYLDIRTAVLEVRYHSFCVGIGSRTKGTVELYSQGHHNALRKVGLESPRARSEDLEGHSAVSTTGFERHVDWRQGRKVSLVRHHGGWCHPLPRRV